MAGRGARRQKELRSDRSHDQAHLQGAGALRNAHHDASAGGVFLEARASFLARILPADSLLHRGLSPALEHDGSEGRRLRPDRRPRRRGRPDCRRGLAHQCAPAHHDGREPSLGLRLHGAAHEAGQDSALRSLGALSRASLHVARGAHLLLDPQQRLFPREEHCGEEPSAALACDEARRSLRRSQGVRRKAPSRARDPRCAPHRGRHGDHGRYLELHFASRDDSGASSRNLPRAPLDGLCALGRGFPELSRSRACGKRPRDGEGADAPRLRSSLGSDAFLPRHNGGVGAHSEGAAASRLDDGGRRSCGARLRPLDASSRRRLREAFALRS